MLVFRCFDALGVPIVQVESHGNCCGTGTCHQPDKRQYEHADVYGGGGLTTAERVVDVIHHYLSGMDDDALTAVLVDHLAARGTRRA